MPPRLGLAARSSRRVAIFRLAAQALPQTVGVVGTQAQVNGRHYIARAGEVIKTRDLLNTKNPQEELMSVVSQTFTGSPLDIDPFVGKKLIPPLSSPMSGVLIIRTHQPAHTDFL